jgi:hypothetical protein
VRRIHTATKQPNRRTSIHSSAMRTIEVTDVVLWQITSSVAHPNSQTTHAADKLLPGQLTGGRPASEQLMQRN